MREFWVEYNFVNGRANNIFICRTMKDAIAYAEMYEDAYIVEVKKVW